MVQEQEEENKSLMKEVIYLRSQDRLTKDKVFDLESRLRRNIQGASCT